METPPPKSIKPSNSDFKVQASATSTTTINCTIKRRENRAGLSVVAYEYKAVEPKTKSPFSRASSHVVRELGKAATDKKGQCEIKFSGGSRETSALAKSSIYIEVYENGEKIGESEKVNIDEVVNFVVEIGLPEPKKQTMVTVVNDDGDTVAGAEIFWRGLKRGVTDEEGRFFIKDVKAGDQLATRLLMHENRTPRQNHEALSTRNWNYRVYTTSVPIEHDSNGDDVTISLHEVTDPNDIQELRISKNNTQVGVNLVVSFEWDATTEELIYYRDRLFETSELLYNASDGQFLIEHLVIADNKIFWNDADYRIYASNDTPSETAEDAFLESGYYMSMNPWDALNPGALMHELAHYVFNVGDEANGTAGCTHEGVNGHGTVFSPGHPKEACVARGDAAQFRSLKICSAHPDNPHVTGTGQGDEDCWTTISKRFNTSPAWKIHTPVTRNAIPGRLPDSGVPIARLTTREPWDVQAASFIPLFGWKPQWHFDDAWREGELPDFKVRVKYYGASENGVHVFIKDPTGRSISQGRTRWIALEYRNGLRQLHGEIIVRGAHTGDVVTASSNNLLIIETIDVSGPNLTLELNFEGWT